MSCHRQVKHPCKWQPEGLLSIAVPWQDTAPAPDVGVLAMSRAVGGRGMRKISSYPCMVYLRDCSCI